MSSRGLRGCRRGAIMHRMLSGGLLSAAVVALGFVSAASAEPVVQRTGNTYHVAVCQNVVGLAARCHAHVVTDKAGHLLTTVQPPLAGLTPSSLRDAYKVTANGT